MFEEKEVTTHEKIIQKIEGRSYVRLEFGCGRNKISQEALSIDMINYPEVDIVGDALATLKLFPSNSVDFIYSSHFLEHIDNVMVLISECHRVLKVGGVVETIVPHFSNPLFYSDYTHKSFWGLYSFSYMMKSEIFVRKVPKYEQEINGLELMKAELIFKSSPPFYLRHVIKKAFQYVFNLNYFTKELYEEVFCKFVSCYEIRFLVKKAY